MGMEKRIRYGLVPSCSRRVDQIARPAAVSELISRDGEMCEQAIFQEEKMCHATRLA